MQIEYLDPNSIVVPGVRVTNHFSEEDQGDFLASIRETGVKEPVLVIRENGTHYVVDGFNRLQAARVAGLGTVPCVVKPGTLRDVLIENLQTATQRGNFKFSEVRRVIATLEREEGLDSDEICKRTGMSRERVENLMWVNGAIPEVQEALDAKEIPLGHSVVIARFKDPDDQALMFALYAQHRPKLELFRAMAAARIEHRAANPPVVATGADFAPAHPLEHPCENCHRGTNMADLRPFMLCPACYGAMYEAVRAAIAAAPEA